MASSLHINTDQRLTLDKLPWEILDMIMDYVLLRHWRERTGRDEKGVDHIAIEMLRIRIVGSAYQADNFRPSGGKLIRAAMNDSSRPETNPLVAARACKAVYASALRRIRHTTICLLRLLAYTAFAKQWWKARPLMTRTR